MKDFSNQNLRGRSFKGQDLTRANFSGADLRGASFTESTLNKAKFSNAIFGITNIFNLFLWFFLIPIIGIIIGFFVSLGASFLSVSTVDIFYPLLNAPFGGRGYENLVFKGIQHSVVIYAPLVFIYMILIKKNIFWSGFIPILIAWITATVIIFYLYPSYSSTIQIIGSSIVSTLVSATGILIISLTSPIIFSVYKNHGIAIFIIASIVAIFIAFLAKHLYSFAFVITSSSIQFMFAFFIALQASREEGQFITLRKIGLTLYSLFGTNFKKADIAESNFTNSNLFYTNLSRANIYRVCFRDAKGLKTSNVSQTILREPKIRELLTTGQGANGDFSYADLHGANLDHANLNNARLDFADLSHASLCGADLRNADLSQAQCVNADFSGATLTGACLEAWNIDSTTILKDVQADFVYLLQNQKERRPASGNFAPGEFTKFFQEVLDTVDLIFREGMDWKAFLISLNNLKVSAGESGEEIAVQSIENKGDNVFVVRLNVPSQIDKATIHEQFQQDYEHQLVLLETRYKAQLEAKDEVIDVYKHQNTDLMQIIRTQADRPFITINTEQSTMSVFDQRGQKVKTQHNVAGDLQQGGDHVDFSGATISGSVLNVKSILENVTQTISTLPNTGAEEKAKLEDLIKQLSEVLQKVPENKAQEAETVSAMAEQTVNAAKSGNKPMFNITAKGFKEAAQAVAGVVPTAVDIAKQIVEALSAKE